MADGKSPEEELHLTTWLENQKERAKEGMHHGDLDAEKQAEWKGEYQLISSIQHYLEHGILELK
jgi:hypothetical protein